MIAKESDKKKRTADFFSQLEAPAFGQEVPLFLAMGKKLAEQAEIPVGATVLDVAAGRGASLFPAAKQTGDGGRVIGIDISKVIVRKTRREIEQRGQKNAEIHFMDAEKLEFPKAFFDRVMCGFALFFFPKLDHALSEFRRVLKPGGRLVVSTFAKGHYPWEWYEDLLKSFNLSFRGGQIDKLVTQHIDSEVEIKIALEGAGFTEIRTSTEDYIYHFADEETWWQGLLSSGDRPLLDTLSPVRLKEFQNAAFEKIRIFKKGEGIRFTDQVIFANAENPLPNI